MVIVAGLPGTGARELAERLPVRAGWVQRPGDVPRAAGAAVLVVDPVGGAGREEAALLADLWRYGHAVALAVARVDGCLRWREAAGAAREILDPAHDVPLFAAIAVGDGVGHGVGELADWCTREAVPGGPGAAIPAAEPPPAVALTCDDVPERAAGARAGFTQLRADAGAAVRAAAAELATFAEPGAGPATGREAAVQRDRLAARAEAITGRLAAGTRREADRILRVALLGTEMELPRLPEPRTAFAAPPGPPGAFGAEDLLVLVLGGSAGFGLARAAAAPLGGWLGLGAYAPVLGSVAGLLLAVWVVVVRRRSAVRGALRRWTSELVLALREHAQHEAAATIGAAEVAVARELGRLRGRGRSSGAANRRVCQTREVSS